MKFTANDFYRWRQDQAKKSITDHHNKRNVKPSIYDNEDDDDDDDNRNVNDLNRDLDDDELDESERYSSSNHDNLYNGGQQFKGNSSPKHKNHKYHQQDHYAASSAEKSYANYSNRHQWSNKRKPTKQQSTPHQYQNNRTRKTKSNSKSRHKNQQPQLYTLETQQQPQYLKTEVRPDVDVNDPTFYSTLPKNLNLADHDDDIYSGLLSMKPSKTIADKSKLLADINYNRKQQTKIFTAQNKFQKQKGELLQSS